ncbi:MAG: Smr/MutS family protein [Acidobacteriota bacterium]|nr:Smr/MutS family protein [Acidobacteriota bacterium]MDH3524628.1 Smr/MutS family protein [Acidobacteriota bacterium]
MAADEERKAFERAMQGVDPIAAGKRLAPRGRRRRGPASERPASEPPVTERPATGGGRLEVTSWGDHHQGAVPGVPDAELRRLERGDYPPELTLDLHGVAEAAARGMVRDLLGRALRIGARCVAIVHGRGLRSPAGPVLKRALPAWLAAPPHGRHVLAFTTLGKHGASGGATLVLLRRPRRS